MEPCAYLSHVEHLSVRDAQLSVRIAGTQVAVLLTPTTVWTVAPEGDGLWTIHFDPPAALAARTPKE